MCYIFCMLKSLSLTIILGACPLVASASPLAEVLCDATPKMRDKLERQFGNTQRAMGIRSPDQVMEVWTGPRGDWTLVITYSTGNSCIVAMGEHWQDAPRDPA